MSTGRTPFPDRFSSVRTNLIYKLPLILPIVKDFFSPTDRWVVNRESFSG